MIAVSLRARRHTIVAIVAATEMIGVENCSGPVMHIVQRESGLPFRGSIGDGQERLARTTHHYFGPHPDTVMFFIVTSGPRFTK
jgi:hypothetical protein